ncbi:MAG TPA: hypothetical protein VFW46_03160 [Stellaceae bacterium]|nr:hypothetical protein [Stellaceae bacterium]
MLSLRHLSVAAALLLLTALPAAGFSLFGHSVDVQFATPDGKPMADAEVKVFAPGEAGKVALTGRTDKDGKFSFEADREGLWTAEARDATEIARATVRVGGGETGGSGAAQSPYLILGLLALLLVIAVWYRYLRARVRRSPPRR